MGGQSSGHPHSYWLATDEEVERVASDLGISLAGDTSRDISGSFSRLFVFGGEENDRRVLKIRARWMTEGRLSFEHALAVHMHNCDLPMVVPLADLHGCTWAKVGELYCETAPFVDGRNASPDHADVRQIGALLGRFHGCSRDFGHSSYEPPHFQNQAEPEEMQMLVEKSCRQNETQCSPIDSEVVREIRGRWNELVDCLDTRSISSLPQVMRHGDFHPWNLLFSRTEPSRIIALFDLDMSARGPRVYDISYAIHMLRRLFIGWKVDDWGSRYRQFVEGYTETSNAPLNEEEIAAATLFIECIALHFWMLEAAGGSTQKAAEEREEYVAITDWLKSWGAELTKTLGGG
jgi:Ser/Thr protein kinase RdoA (MazF antagonist)